MATLTRLKPGLPLCVERSSHVLIQSGSSLNSLLQSIEVYDTLLPTAYPGQMDMVHIPPHFIPVTRLLVTIFSPAAALQRERNSRSLPNCAYGAIWEPKRDKVPLCCRRTGKLTLVRQRDLVSAGVRGPTIPASERRFRRRGVACNIPTPPRHRFPGEV